MQADDRGDHTEAKPRSREMTNLIAAIKALQYGLTLTLWNTGPVVRDHKLRALPEFHQVDSHFAMVRCELDGIVQQVAERFEKQGAVAVDRGHVSGLQAQANATVFSSRLIQLAHSGNGAGGVDG